MPHPSPRIHLLPPIFKCDVRFQPSLYKLYSQSIFDMKRAPHSSHTVTGVDQHLPASKNPLRNSIIDQLQSRQSDEQFSQIIQGILSSAFFRSRSRHIKIKLQCWMEILQRNEFNSVWRENKLNYLKLLSLMCQCEYVLPPFTGFPKQDALPLLQRHEIDRIIDEVEREVRNSKLPTKRHNQERNQLTKAKNTRKSSQNYKERIQYGGEIGKSNEGKENYRQKNREKRGVNDVKGNALTRKKERFQVNHQTPVILKLSPLPKSKEKTQRPNESMPKFHTNSIKGPKTIILPTFHADLSSSSLHPQNSGYLSRSPKHNAHKSISESISLQLSPVSVSSKVWQLTHKKKGKEHGALNKTFDLSKMVRTTVESSKYPRHSDHSHLYARVEDDYSTGDALRAPRKQYWQTNTFTGNGTPKYLNSFNQINNLSFTQTDNQDSLREEGDCCLCYYPLWNN